MGRWVIAAASGIGAMVVLALAGVPALLGAHPVWAVGVAVYGVVPGLLLADFLRRVTRFALWFALLDLCLAYGVAAYGKARFVASRGDDAFAGQLWFLGWIAVCACAVAVVMLVVMRLSGKPAE